MEDLYAPSQAFREGRSAYRHYHELLEIYLIVRMSAAVQDIHHGHRQCPGVGAAYIPVQGQAGAYGARFGRSKADSEDGIGAQLAFVFGAVQLQQHFIYARLVCNIPAQYFLRDELVDILYSIQYAFSQVGTFIAVSQLCSFVDACGCPGGYRCSSHSAVFRENIDLYGRITS